MPRQLLHIAADNLIRYDRARDSATGDFLNAATISKATLKDSLNADVAGAVDIPLVYVAGSDGRYHGTIDAGVALVNLALYTLEITFAEGALEDFRKILCVAVDRGVL